MYYFTMYFSRCVRNGNGGTRVRKVVLEVIGIQIQTWKFSSWNLFKKMNLLAELSK